MSTPLHPLKKYTRPHVTRTTTCPGCGNGIITQAILRAIDELGLVMDDFVFVSGIGCSAWIPSPLFAADTLHTTHGRPIAFATGVKLGLPHQHVFVASGDGDLAAIGGNHLIHAARRNVDLTGRAGQQWHLRYDWRTSCPNNPPRRDHHQQPLRQPGTHFRYLCHGGGRGAFVARWTTYHPRQFTRSIKKGIQKKGFALVEVVSQCPVQFGKVTKMGRAIDILKHYKRNSILIDKAKTLDEEGLKGKIVVGEFVNVEKPELSSEWDRLKREMMEDSK